MGNDEGKRGRTWAITLPLFLLMASVLGVLWWLDLGEWHAGVRSQVSLTAEQAAFRLEDYVRDRLLIVESFARASAQEETTDPEQWRVRAEIAQDEFGGFQAINWTRADSTIEMVTPLEPNREALGRRVLDHPQAHEAFRRARASGQPRLASPIDLFQGGRGFATYFPFEVDGERRYVNGVFRIRPLVQTALRGGVLDDYSVRLIDGREPLLALPEEGQATEAPSARAPIVLLDRRWELEVRPRASLWSSMKESQPGFSYGLAFLLLALMVVAVHAALVRQIARQRAEEERRELERRLERASKMEALGRLAGGVAHDFNNILTAILNSVELLREPAAAVDHGPFAVDTIVDASTRAAELTRQLLTFARHAPSAPTILDFNEQLGSLRRMLERLLPARVELQLELDPALPPVMLSASHLGQIVVNLVVNAADALPEGGHIVLRTRSEDGEVVLEVEDDGTGMDEATLERIFEPFFTTKDSGKGTGLGLATVYGLVQGYEGTIDVRSEVDVGTVFELRFPAHLSAEATPVPEGLADPTPDPARPFAARRLLVVEDDDGVREALRRGLQMMGHEVHLAADGEAAIPLLEAEDYDAVVSDVLMPKVDGLELLEWIRERQPTLPVVLCSGHTGSREVVDGDDFTELHQKPFAMDAIQETLEELWNAAAEADEDATTASRP